MTAGSEFFGCPGGRLLSRRGKAAGPFRAETQIVSIYSEMNCIDLLPERRLVRGPQPARYCAHDLKRKIRRLANEE